MHCNITRSSNEEWKQDIIKLGSKFKRSVILQFFHKIIKLKCQETINVLPHKWQILLVNAAARFVSASCFYVFQTYPDWVGHKTAQRCLRQHSHQASLKKPAALSHLYLKSFLGTGIRTSEVSRILNKLHHGCLKCWSLSSEMLVAYWSTWI